MSPPGAAPDRGDVVWVDFDPRAGHEQAGLRPGLVVSPASYNGLVGLALICPITGQRKGYSYEVPIPPGLPVYGVVLSDQVRSMDWRARSVRFACRLPPAVTADVVARLKSLLP